MTPAGSYCLLCLEQAKKLPESLRILSELFGFEIKNVEVFEWNEGSEVIFSGTETDPSYLIDNVGILMNFDDREKWLDTNPFPPKVTTEEVRLSHSRFELLGPAYWINHAADYVAKNKIQIKDGNFCK